MKTLTTTIRPTTPRPMTPRPMTPRALVTSAIEPLEDRRLYSATPVVGAAGPFARAIGGEQVIERTISGRAFDDKNANGKRDRGEKGLFGRTVFLDGNNNGQLDAGEPVTTTARSGKYEIDGVPAGTFKVQLQGVASARSTTAPRAIKAAAFSTHEIKNVDLGSTEVAQLAGKVYVDANGNGAQDATDVDGNENYSVVLRAAKGNKKVVARCNANGDFEFPLLKAGTYTVETRVGKRLAGLQAPLTVTLAGGAVQTGLDVGHVPPTFIAVTQPAPA